MSAKLVRDTWERIDGTHAINRELHSSLETSFSRLEQSHSTILKSDDAIEELTLLRGGKETIPVAPSTKAKHLPG